jgi:hypothetical protein
MRRGQAKLTGAAQPADADVLDMSAFDASALRRGVRERVGMLLAEAHGASGLLLLSGMQGEDAVDSAGRLGPTQTRSAIVGREGNGNHVAGVYNGGVQGTDRASASNCGWCASVGRSRAAPASRR